MGEKLTWRDRLTNLRRALGREPTLAEKLECASIHQMTPDEIEAQRLSFVRAFTARCELSRLAASTANWTSNNVRIAVAEPPSPVRGGGDRKGKK